MTIPKEKDVLLIGGLGPVKHVGTTTTKMIIGGRRPLHAATLILAGLNLLELTKVHVDLSKPTSNEPPSMSFHPDVPRKGKGEKKRNKSKRWR